MQPALSFLASILISAFPSAHAGETLKVVASTSTAGQVDQLKEVFKSSTGIEVVGLSLNGVSSYNVLLALDQGKADLGFIGNNLKVVQKVINARAVKLKEPGRLKEFEVARDLLRFFTHKDGPQELTKEQLKQIVTGKARNWKEVGGGNVAIKLAFNKNAPSALVRISETLLDGNEINRQGSIQVESFSDLNAFVAKNEGAIGFAGAFVIREKEVNIPKQPEMSKIITAVTLGAPSMKAQKFIDLFKKRFAQ